MFNEQFWSSPEVTNYFKVKSYNSLMLEWVQAYSDFQGGSIIDIGCGYGRNLIPFAHDSHYKIYCFDSCPVALTYTMERFNLCPNNCKVASIQSKPWFGQKFDFIICDGVLHQVASSEQIYEAFDYCSSLFEQGFFFLSLFTSDIIPSNCTFHSGHLWENQSGIKMTLLNSHEIATAFQKAKIHVLASKHEIFKLDVGVRSNSSYLLSKDVL